MDGGTNSERAMLRVNPFSISRHIEKVAQIATVVPSCERCATVMHIANIFAHPRFPRVEIVSFHCDCGATENRVVPHSIK
jgi:hypothetical protein